MRRISDPPWHPVANLRLPNQRPIVNVVAVFMIVLSAIPVYLSYRLSSESTGGVTR